MVDGQLQQYFTAVAVDDMEYALPSVCVVPVDTLCGVFEFLAAERAFRGDGVRLLGVFVHRWTSVPAGPLRREHGWAAVRGLVLPGEVVFVTVGDVGV